MLNVAYSSSLCAGPMKRSYSARNKKKLDGIRRWSEDGDNRQQWTDYVEGDGQIDVIYTHFAKAFDKVPHKRLIHKLEAYNINENLVLWIMAFLTNRQQKVKVNGTLSEWLKVIVVVSCREGAGLHQPRSRRLLAGPYLVAYLKALY